MERPWSPSTSPIFLVGVAVIVIISQVATVGINSFWWRLAVMVLIALVLSWPLRLILRASDRRYQRRLHEDAMRRE